MDQVSSSSSSSSPCLVLHAETRAAIEDITASNAAAVVVSKADNDTIIVAPVEIILNKAHMYIGRSSIKLPVDILLIARKGERDVISRRHAEITIHNKIVIADADDEINTDEINRKVIHQYILHDLKSINGVFVNEIKIDTVVLSDGDIIQFGGVSNMDYGSKLKSSDTCIKYVFQQKRVGMMNIISQQQQQQQQQQQEQKLSIDKAGTYELDDGDGHNIKNKCSKTKTIADDDILEINGNVVTMNKHQDGSKHDIDCRVHPPNSNSSRMTIQGHDNTTTTTTITTPTILKKNEMNKVHDSRTTHDDVTLLKSTAVRNLSDSTSTLKRKHSSMINNDDNNNNNNDNNNKTINRIDDVQADKNKNENKHSTGMDTGDVTKNKDDIICIMNNKNMNNVIRDDGIKANNSSAADVNFEANVKEDLLKNKSRATHAAITHKLPPTTTTTSSSTTTTTTTTTTTGSNSKAYNDDKTTNIHNDYNPHHLIKTVGSSLASETKDNKQQIKQNNNESTHPPNDNSSSSSSSSFSKVITEQVYMENQRNLQNQHSLVLCNLIKSHHSNEKLSKERMDILLKEHQVEKTQLLRLITQYKSELSDYKQRQDQEKQNRNVIIESVEKKTSLVVDRNKFQEEEQQKLQQQQQHESKLHDECIIIEELKMKIKSFEDMINNSNNTSRGELLSNQQWQAKYDNDMESLRLTLNDRFEIEKNHLLTTWQINCNHLEQKLKDTNNSTQININKEDINNKNNINKNNIITATATATTSFASSQKDHPTMTNIIDGNNNRDDENRLLNIITTIEASLICFLCSELLLDAVVLSCSHGFCRACIESHWNKNKQKIDIDYNRKKNTTVLSCCYCPKCNMNVSIKTTSSTSSNSNYTNRSNNNINKNYNSQESRMIDHSVSNYFRSDHLDNLVGIIVDTFPDSLKTVSSTV